MILLDCRSPVLLIVPLVPIKSPLSSFVSLTFLIFLPTSQRILIPPSSSFLIFIPPFSSRLIPPSLSPSYSTIIVIPLSPSSSSLIISLDPHEANMLVRAHPSKKGYPQVVLLDHGLYKGNVLHSTVPHCTSDGRGYKKIR
jgi:hypothetical protein